MGEAHAERFRADRPTDARERLRERRDTPVLSSDLQDEIALAIASANDWVRRQLTRTTPAWPIELGGDLNPWVTGQLASLTIGSAQASDIELDLAIAWIQQAQNLDGSWGSSAYGTPGDTASTASCTIAVTNRLGEHSVPAEKGLRWLCQKFSRGLTSSPYDATLPQIPFYQYGIAFGLRALARGPHLPLNSECIRGGMAELIRSLSPEGGWGYDAASPSDPTLTCYVLHGLLDLADFWGAQFNRTVIDRAVDWLVAQQAPTGEWGDWHGTGSSVEATAYAVYILLRTGHRDQAEVLSGLSALLGRQNTDGSWSLPPDVFAPPNNWVTSTAVMALLEWAGPPAKFRSETVPSSLGSLPFTFYESPVQTPIDHIPKTRPMDHTMATALDSYVESKLPTGELIAALANEVMIEVHGIYPGHAEETLKDQGYSEVSPVLGPEEQRKSYNTVRPRFFKAKSPAGDSVFLVCVVPGADYVLQYASMVRHFALTQTTSGDAYTRVFRYPTAEEALPQWTGLDESIVRNDDTVILGSVEQIGADLATKGFRIIKRAKNEFFGAYEHILPDGRSLLLLGVTFSYWGSISLHLCHRLCSLGAREILYVAKLGSLVHPNDLYQRIYCPSRFIVLRHDRINYEVVPSPPNGVLMDFPALDTGTHVSVPTVLEEDYRQRQLATDLGAQSIDNEISQMAWAVNLFNNSNPGSSVGFSPVHFATDYVRKPGERLMRTRYHLANNRRQAAREAKRDILRRITSEVLLPYLVK